MKWNEVFCNTFKAMSERLAPEIERRVNFMLPSLPMVEACRASEFDFLQVLIGQGVITTEQALHSAECYRLGKTKTGRTIFWMIDDIAFGDGHAGAAAGQHGNHLSANRPHDEQLRVFSRLCQAGRTVLRHPVAD